MTKLIFVFVALFAVVTFGREISITDFGANGADSVDDSAAINAAIKNATAGDTVVVPDGTFYISSTINAKSGLTFRGNGDSSRIVRTTKGVFFGADKVNNFEVASIFFDGNNMSTHGLVFSNAQNLSLHHLRIENIPFYADTFGPMGIYLSANVQNSHVYNNTIYNIGPDSEWGSGIRVNGGGYNLIEYNFVNHTGRGGIFLSSGSEHNIVRKNVVRDSGLANKECLGIESWSKCHYTLIEDNDVDHWISLDTCYFCTVRRNRVASATKNCYCGLEAVASKFAVFTDNVVMNNQSLGISISNDPVKDYSFFAYNTLHGMRSFGAQVMGGNGGTYHHYFYKNIFEFTTTPSMSNDEGHGFRFNGKAFSIVLEENIIRNNARYGIQTYSPVDNLEFYNNTIENNGDRSFSGSTGLTFVWENNTVQGNKVNVALASYNVTNQRPTAQIDCPESIQLGTAVTISGSNSMDADGTIVQVLWDLDEGLPQNDTILTWTYNTVGQKRITLLVWDNGGRAARAEKIVNVFDPNSQGETPNNGPNSSQNSPNSSNNGPNSTQMSVSTRTIVPFSILLFVLGSIVILSN